MPEQIPGVEFSEQIPAEDGGKGKEKQGNGNKCRPQSFPQNGPEGRLCQIGGGQPIDLGSQAGPRRTQNALSGIQGDDHHQGRDRDDAEGTNENAHHGNTALLMGPFDLRQRVGVGRRAHAGLVGK